jgi:hypothetical protein
VSDCPVVGLFELAGCFVPRYATLASCHVGVGVLAADSQSTSTSGYRASLWDP